MAESVQFFMTTEDEVAFFRYLERFHMEGYPLRIPPDWEPVKIDAQAGPKLPDIAYLAASEIGDVVGDKIKTGPEKGYWHVDERKSPVFYFERCKLNDEGELLSGMMWAETSPQPREYGKAAPAPDRFMGFVNEVEMWLRKTFRKSDPKGFLIGPKAARMTKEGLVLRDAAHRGGTVRPFGGR